MPRTLIILAHPDNRSFTGSWAEATAQASKAAGHEVLWSDLYAMDFDPIEKRSHYPEYKAQDAFDVLKAQENASENSTLPVDVHGEIEKLQSADRLIFHFPIWWFAPPAILKGWCERVLAHGALHTTDQRFDTGLFRGKTVLFCATTGSKSEESAFNGKEGDIQMLLWPLAYTLRYLGFDVLTPRVLHGIHGYHKGASEVALRARLQSELVAHKDAISKFDTLPKMAFNADSEFSAEGRLSPEAPSHSPFIRHLP